MFFVRKTSLIQKAAVIGSSALLSACATMSAGNLFSHYSAQTKEVYFAVRNGNYLEAQASLNQDIAGPILDNMEKGRVSFLAEDYPQSLSFFQVSDNAVKVLNDRAIISVSETASSVGALATNDNLTTYEPADYELGFLHLYLGLNYLKKNDLSGALVEMRRPIKFKSRQKNAGSPSLSLRKNQQYSKVSRQTLPQSWLIIQTQVKRFKLFKMVTYSICQRYFMKQIMI